MRKINRMMLLGALGLMLSTLGSPEMAHADWQYTKWGMTIDEVVSASGGRLKRCPQSPCKPNTINLEYQPEVVGEHSAGSLLFEVELSFRKDNGRLAQVMTTLRKKAQWSYAVTALREKYGEPDPNFRDEFVWRTASETIVAPTGGPFLIYFAKHVPEPGMRDGL